MKYLLLISDDESYVPNMEELAAMPAIQAFEKEINRRSNNWIGGRLRPVADATTVRVRRGETLVSDGPFAETKDFVGGFIVVECADLDEAIAIAAAHPWAQWNSIEIRPVWE